MTDPEAGNDTAPVEQTRGRVCISDFGMRIWDCNPQSPSAFFYAAIFSSATIPPPAPVPMVMVKTSLGVP